MEIFDKVILETAQSSNNLRNYEVESLGNQLKDYFDVFVHEHKINLDIIQGVLGDLHDNEDCKINLMR